MSRIEASDLLMNERECGTFLIRDSLSIQGDYVLCVRYVIYNLFKRASTSSMSSKNILENIIWVIRNYKKSTNFYRRIFF